MNYIDPFGLEEKRWWQFWKKEEEVPLPKTDVTIEEVTVTAEDKSKSNSQPSMFANWFSQWGAYSQPGGISMSDGKGWNGYTASHVEDIGSVNDMPGTGMGKGGGNSRGTKFWDNIAKMFGKTADIVEKTTDETIIETKTGTGEKLNANRKPINDLSDGAFIAERTMRLNGFNTRSKVDTALRGDTIEPVKYYESNAKDTLTYFRVKNASRGKYGK